MSFSRLGTTELLALLEHSPNAILTVDDAGVITSWNKGASSIYGYSVEEAIGMNISALWPEDQRADQLHLHKQVILGKAMEPFECRRLRKDGTPIDLAVTLAPLPDANGKVIGVAKIAFDISQRKQAQREEMAAAQRFQLLADNIDQLVWIVSPDGTDWWFNKRWLEYTGMRSEEIIPRSHEIHHPEHLERVTATLGEAGKKGVSWQEEFPLRRHDGEWRWFLSRAVPVRDEQGQVVKWFGTSTDITEYKKVREDHEANEARMRELLKENQELMDALDEHAIVAITDRKGRIIKVNDKFCEISGYEREELLGKDHRIINSSYHPPEFIKGLWDTIRNGGVWHGAIRNKRKDGSFYWVDTTIVPFLDEQGRPRQFVSIRTDITEHRRLLELLEQEARQKDQFLATLAHELRNPMAPLMNGLEIIDMSYDDRMVLDRTQKMMVRQLSHLDRLVNDLMDISRIRRGTIHLNKAIIDLREVVQQGIEAVVGMVQLKEQQLNADLPQQPVIICGDRTRLVQVVGNLLSNANKYTPSHGRIQVSLRSEGGQAVLHVSDNGIGIAPQDIDQAFELFTQLGNVNKNERSGLGIGLNVVKQLVEMHKGSIQAWSEGLGKGSTFEIRLDLEKDAKLEQGATPEYIVSAGQKNLKILVVDDLQDITRTLATLLEAQGHLVEVANDGEQAVRKAEQFLPQLILMDLGMPGVDGITACKMIRSQPWGRNMRIVAVTGWGQPVDVQRSKEAGFDEHQVKPIPGKVIQRILADVSGAFEPR